MGGGGHGIGLDAGPRAAFPMIRAFEFGRFP